MNPSRTPLLLISAFSFAMLAVALIAFAMFRYVGDPVTSMVGQDTPPNNAPNCPNSSA